MFNNISTIKILISLVIISLAAINGTHISTVNQSENFFLHEVSKTAYASSESDDSEDDEEESAWDRFWNSAADWVSDAWDAVSDFFNSDPNASTYVSPNGSFEIDIDRNSMDEWTDPAFIQGIDGSQNYTGITFKWNF